MKVIVFGGSGFLGSHVAEALSKAGHKVTIYDITPSRYLCKDQKMIVGDILDEDKVQRAVKGQQVVYNFAGFADIESARNKPIETIRMNILGCGIILEAARLAKVKRFVFASTVYVYSRAGAFYRASKQACEAYIESYNQMYGLPYTILRYGSLYGPRADKRNGIFRLLQQALTNRQIVYWGDGEELREYIHVADAALSSVEILASDFLNQCVILTGNQPLRVKNILTMIREIMNKKVKLVYKKGSRAGLSDIHYDVTPYSYVPKEGKKFVRRHYVDMGQGLLSLIGEFHSARSSGGQ